MTVAGLTKLVLKLTILSAICYYVYYLHIVDNGLNTFDVSFQNNGLFALSFMISTLYIVFIFACTVLYLIGNSGKSIVIVLSPRYLKDNYWKDISKTLD